MGVAYHFCLVGVWVIGRSGDFRSANADLDALDLGSVLIVVRDEFDAYIVGIAADGGCRALAAEFCSLLAVIY